MPAEVSEWDKCLVSRDPLPETQRVISWQLSMFIRVDISGSSVSSDDLQQMVKSS